MLTRITVNLTPSAVAALDRLCADGTSKTDALCRAVRVAAVLDEIAAGRPFTVVNADGTRDRIHIV